MKKVKLRKVGNSYGLTLPRELLEKYNIKEGDELYIVESSDGFKLSPYDPDFKQWAVCSLLIIKCLTLEVTKIVFTQNQGLV